jgi:hypothetical protein
MLFVEAGALKIKTLNLADDLGYGDVKCFNPEGKIPTPNLSRSALLSFARHRRTGKC